MYISGEYPDGRISDAYPCKSCQKAIINAGIEKIIIRNKDSIEKISVPDWVEEAKKTEDKDIKGYY